MDLTFEKVLKEQAERYPKMKPSDYGKLAYQSEFGAEHMVSDRSAVLANLIKEKEALPLDTAPFCPEPIGERLCRFPVALCEDEESVCLLADLFIKTAQNSRGTKEGLLEKIACITKYEVKGWQEWLADWEKKGYPAVHHSETYRMAYHPHYRLLQKEYAAYFPALLEIGRLARMDKPVRIGIDGRCGSGKTHFAKLAGSLFSCNVIHMDDFYLPVEKRSANWEEIPGGNMDFARLNKEVLIPLREGRQSVYRPYSCETGGIAEEKRLPVRNITVIEGSYSHHPSLCGEYDMKIFLDCEAEEQRNRLKVREGDYYPAFAGRWIPMEERYLQHYKIRENCELCIDTSELFIK